MQVRLSALDERVAAHLLTLYLAIQTYKLQRYCQLHRDVIDSASRDPDPAPGYVDLDVTERSHSSQLVRCGLTRSHVQQPRRRFSVF